MKRTSGFTIVEVTIVVIVIAILATITLVSYGKVQADSRDKTREGNVTVIVEGLEKYFMKNGEYPSERSIVNDFAGNTGTVVAGILGVNASDLKMPQAASSVTNSLNSAATPTGDSISYIATDTLNNANCQSSLTGGCDQYTLKYNKENSGLITIVSRHHP
ncbi:MAG TPA: prepilin-type N-terminal cleavage/methylation domain-containing protein [Candidatus Saccharimonadales bacterium]|nr:prepilin-type N-terminal cleavage/methylation domain-containing protein [Candidatus Saccharimonadales bacterium]